MKTYNMNLSLKEIDGIRNNKVLFKKWVDMGRNVVVAVTKDKLTKEHVKNVRMNLSQLTKTRVDDFYCLDLPESILDGVLKMTRFTCEEGGVRFVLNRVGGKDGQN